MPTKFLLLTFLFIPSLLVSRQDHTTQIATYPKEQEPPTPFPSFVRDTSHHKGYFVGAVLIIIVIGSILGVALHSFWPVGGCIPHLVLLGLGVLLPLSFIVACFFKGIGQVDNYPNRLALLQRFRRVVQFLFLPLLMNVVFFLIRSVVQHVLSDCQDETDTENRSEALEFVLIAVPQIILNLIAWTCMQNYYDRAATGEGSSIGVS